MLNEAGGMASIHGPVWFCANENGSQVTEFCATGSTPTYNVAPHQFQTCAST